jgi:O-antigen ligase
MGERTSQFMSTKLSKPRVYETLLFIALLSGPPALRVRDPSASLSGNADWSVLLNAAVWALGAFWVFLNLGGYVLKARSIPRLGLLYSLAILLVFCLYLSTLTSLVPILTFYRVSQILIAVLFGFFWVRRFGVHSTLRHLLGGYLTLCVAIAVASNVAPDLVYTTGTTESIYGETVRTDRATRLRGDAIANTGSVAAMGFVLLLSYPFVIKSRIIFLGMLALAVTLMAMAQTRASFAVVLLFLLLALIRFPRTTPLRAFLYFLAALIPVLALRWMTTVFEYLLRGQEDSVGTLSDRLPLWQYIVSEVLERSPWTGVGLYANRSIATEYNPGLGTSHSAFVEIFSGGGILAFSVFVAILGVELFLALRSLIVSGANPGVFAVVSLFFSTILIGITSEEMVISSPTSFTFWLMLSLIPATSGAVYTHAQRGEIGISANSSAGSRVLPTTRR